MKNKIAVNAKYFKSSQVDSVQGHVMRLFAEDKNAIASLTKDNFGTPNSTIKKRFEQAFKGVKGVKSNSNTLVDAVFVFPLEQWQNASMSKEEIHAAMIKTMRDIELETGFAPLGYKMHLDEGHTDETGKFILNPHAHMQFANACQKDITLIKQKNVTVKDDKGKSVKDKKTKKWLYERDQNGDLLKVEEKISLKGKMPLQYHRGRGSDSVWSKMQDLAASNFNQYGFVRGDNAELTKRKHLSKEKFVQKQIVETGAELDQLQVQNRALVKTNKNLVKVIDDQKLAITIADLKINSLELKFKSLELKLKSFSENLVKYVKKSINGFRNEHEKLVTIGLYESIEPAERVKARELVDDVEVQDSPKLSTSIDELKISMKEIDSKIKIKI